MADFLRGRFIHSCFRSLIFFHDGRHPIVHLSRHGYGHTILVTVDPLMLCGLLTEADDEIHEANLWQIM